MKWIGFFFGLGFGFCIAAGRFNHYNVIHNALRLQDFYVFAVMGSAVLTAMPILYVLRRWNWKTPLGGPLEINQSKVERKHVYGGIVFGAGWAIAATCPAPALAMIGSGGVLGVLVVAGIFAGLHLRDLVADGAARGQRSGMYTRAGHPGTRSSAPNPVPLDL